jgi:hypothetical protein
MRIYRMKMADADPDARYENTDFIVSDPAVRFPHFHPIQGDETIDNATSSRSVRNEAGPHVAREKRYARRLGRSRHSRLVRSGHVLVRGGAIIYGLLLAAFGGGAVAGALGGRGDPGTLYE